MKESTAEARASKIAFLRQAVMKQRACKVQSKVFDGEARKAFFEQAHIKIMEHRARMELRDRARKADPMPPTSSTASPPNPNFNLVLELPKSSSPAAAENLKEKHNGHDQIKPVWVEPPWAKSSEIGGVKEKNCYVYDSRDPSFQESVVPGYIKEYCTLALEKYNNEKGTNYRYVRPLRAHEGGKTHDTIYTLTFRASQSDPDSDSETFITKITSGLRFSKGEWFFGKEVQQVSQVLGARQFGW